MVVGTRRGVGSFIREPAASTAAATAGALPLHPLGATATAFAGAAPGTGAGAGADADTGDINRSINAIMNDDDLPALAAAAAAGTAAGAAEALGAAGAADAGVETDGDVAVMFVRQPLPPPTARLNASAPSPTNGTASGNSSSHGSGTSGTESGRGDGVGLLWAIPVPAAQLAAPNVAPTGPTTLTSGAATATTVPAAPAVVAGYADGRVIVWRLDFPAQGSAMHHVLDAGKGSGAAFDGMKTRFEGSQVRHQAAGG